MEDVLHLALGLLLLREGLAGTLGGRRAGSVHLSIFSEVWFLLKASGPLSSSQGLKSDRRWNGVGFVPFIQEGKLVLCK